MRDEMPDVRQSAYALVGDLAKACINELRPLLGEYLPVLTVQLDPAYVSVCNNASWAIGEIAIKARRGPRNVSCVMGACEMPLRCHASLQPKSWLLRLVMRSGPPTGGRRDEAVCRGGIAAAHSYHQSVRKRAAGKNLVHGHGLCMPLT